MSAWRDRRGPVSASTSADVSTWTIIRAGDDGRRRGAWRGGLQFPFDVGERSRGRRVTQAFEDAQSVQALAFAEPAGAGGVVGDRFAHDVALGLAEARGRLPDLRDRLVVQGEGDAYHNQAILP